MTCTSSPICHHQTKADFIANWHHMGVEILGRQKISSNIPSICKGFTILFFFFCLLCWLQMAETEEAYEDDSALLEHIAAKYDRRFKLRSHFQVACYAGSQQDQQVMYSAEVRLYTRLVRWFLVILWRQTSFFSFFQGLSGRELAVSFAEALIAEGEQDCAGCCSAFSRLFNGSLFRCLSHSVCLSYAAKFVRAEVLDMTWGKENVLSSRIRVDVQCHCPSRLNKTSSQ